MIKNNDEKSKKAWSFLKYFRGNDATINIVCIDPLTHHIEGITKPVNDVLIYEFIKRYNGTRNLYFMVNTPYNNAPNKKLQKEDVEFINGVWLDADPDKDKCLDEERERLFKFADKLANEPNPPTYIVDSGGGIQAFWVLQTPVEANAENISLYEGYSRGLVEQYSTDTVQNIDRIMRIPYTLNIPTLLKIKAGRKPAPAKVYYASSKTGHRYD